MKILEAFRKKEKDKAEFWIEMNGRFIVISYKPIYDDAGTYLGTLEMSWDATDITGAGRSEAASGLVAVLAATKLRFAEPT